MRWKNVTVVQLPKHTGWQVSALIVYHYSLVFPLQHCWDRVARHTAQSPRIQRTISAGDSHYPPFFWTEWARWLDQTGSRGTEGAACKVGKAPASSAQSFHDLLRVRSAAEFFGTSPPQDKGNEQQQQQPEVVRNSLPLSVCLVKPMAAREGSTNFPRIPNSNQK